MTKTKIDGIGSAIIAVSRYQSIPPSQRRNLAAQGVGESEALVILSMQIMLSPETVTAEELENVATYHRLNAMRGEDGS